MPPGAAALPLIALAVVPSTSCARAARTSTGCCCSCCSRFFMWGERIRSDDAAAVAGAWPRSPRCVAVVIAPALDTHKPWVELRGAGRQPRARSRRAVRLDPELRPAELAAQGPRGDRRQGPAHRTTGRPRTSTSFDGRGWVSGDSVSGGDQLAGVERSDRSAAGPRRSTVTIRAMKTTQRDRRRIRAASRAQLPSRPSRATAPAPGHPRPNSAPATATPPRCTTRIPRAAQLASAGEDYSGAPIAGYRTMVLPVSTATRSARSRSCSRRSTPTSLCWQCSGGPTNVAPRRSSRRRRTAACTRWHSDSSAGPTTPYAFVSSVKGYLSHGFSYNEDTPSSQYPLVRFLFTDKLGYCQQFAGTMALLLRMGGVPARVAVGFTTGSYDSARTSTSSPTSMPTPGSRPGSRTTAGSGSIRPRRPRRPAAARCRSCPRPARPRSRAPAAPGLRARARRVGEDRRDQHHSQLRRSIWAS